LPENLSLSLFFCRQVDEARLDSPEDTTVGFPLSWDIYPFLVSSSADDKPWNVSHESPRECDNVRRMMSDLSDDSHPLNLKNLIQLLRVLLRYSAARRSSGISRRSQDQNKILSRDIFFYFSLLYFNFLTGSGINGIVYNFFERWFTSTVAGQYLLGAVNLQGCSLSLWLAFSLLVVVELVFCAFDVVWRVERRVFFVSFF
jgi:hypothetical protein